MKSWSITGPSPDANAVLEVDLSQSNASSNNHFEGHGLPILKWYGMSSCEL
jgi:hypothetical protein